MGTMQDCGAATREIIARLTTPSRNRYYYGKLLDTYHLDLEQSYEISKRWMLNRLSLGAGVLCGLHVSISNDRKLVRVGSGVAIDYWGREIIVPSSSPGVDPTQPTDSCGNDVGEPVRGGNAVTLYVCYHECEAEPSQALVSECDERACENGIVREKYRLQIRAGVPRPPGSLTDNQCTSIFGPLPANTTRRIVACKTLNPSCDAPDESCIPIATITLDDKGLVRSVDECSYRTTVYSNAVLLDLIFCLAARVDVCCGGTVSVKALEIVSGEPQVGTAGQPMPQPLVTRVTDGGASVANEPVTFTVTTGGGMVGATTATLAATFTVNTDASGQAACPVWLAGPAPGPQLVTASIAVGAPSQVAFHARVARSVAKPPVVNAVWPPPSAILSASSTDTTMQMFMELWRRHAQLQVTFDRKMTINGGKVSDWIRLFMIRSNSQIMTHYVPPTIAQIPLKYTGPVGTPILGTPGDPCEGFEIAPPGKSPIGDTFILVMNATVSEIMSAEPTPLLLDPDFAGTGLTPTQLDELWAIPVAPTPVPAGLLAGLVGPAATLPSGDGVSGGRFSSFFAIAAQ